MPSLLSDVLPRWDVGKRHAIELDAPPERVWAALHETTLGDMPVARFLFRLRGLPSAPERGLLELEGFQRIAEEPPRELVVGAVGRPWVLTAQLERDADLRTFSDPGFAKLALNVTYDGRLLATETRVQLTDSRSRLLFKLYWLVIGPFSGVIRRRWLRAIKRRVEHGAGA
jgi:hypothetical protein